MTELDKILEELEPARVAFLQELEERHRELLLDQELADFAERLVGEISENFPFLDAKTEEYRDKNSLEIKISFMKFDRAYGEWRPERTSNELFRGNPDSDHEVTEHELFSKIAASERVFYESVFSKLPGFDKFVENEFTVRYDDGTADHYHKLYAVFEVKERETDWLLLDRWNVTLDENEDD